MARFFKKNIFVLILFFVWGVLVWKNFVPNTLLTGWDNLHPEFDFRLNIERSLFAVWQEYQGLGLLGGMAHSADLPRQVILFIASIIVPMNLIRYFWLFSMLILGSLGVYSFVKTLFKNDENNLLTENLSAFFAGLFYLLNLATLQYFYTPYESFISFFGFFPWLLFLALSYLKEGRRKQLFWFFVVSLLGASSFYVQTLFIVYLVFLSAFAIEFALRERSRAVLRSIKMFFVLFGANAFWLIPVVYFSLTNSQIIGLSKINSIATPETELMNQAHGNLKDIALLRGYWFDYYDFKAGGSYDYLFSDWMNHLSGNKIETLGMVVFTVAMAGIILLIFRKQSFLKLSFILLFLISFVMLATVNPPFGSIYGFISDKIPFFAEIFRNAFTKWSIAMAFIYSVGIASFVFFTTRALKGKLMLINVFGLLTILGIIFFMVKPDFDGKLIYSRVQINQPSEYKELFSYLKTQDPNGRIALLPAYSFWGWDYYSWGYDGSGFLWYGVRQPILARAFDVWSPYNEGFYNELRSSILRRDSLSFENVLKKYQVKYLILDNSVISPGGSQKDLYSGETKDLIFSSFHIKSLASFNFLQVYRTDFASDKFVSAPNSYARIDADLMFTDQDPFISKFGNYIQEKSGTSYPFANFDARGDLRFQMVSQGLDIKNIKDNTEIILPTKNAIEVKFPSDQGYKNGFNCDLKKNGSIVKEARGNGNFYGAYNGGVSCDYFYYQDIKDKESYILHIKGENLKGRGLKIYFQNASDGRIEDQYLLPTGVFDQYYFFDSNSTNGYNLNVETRSFGIVSSENIIREIEFIPIPADWLRNYSQSKEPQIIENGIRVDSVNKLGTAFYSVKTNGKGLLELGQGFDNGWIALDGFQLLNHVKVNSWANGWIVENTKYNILNTIYIIYWSQLLEYLGFIIMILAGLCLLRRGA